MKRSGNSPFVSFGAVAVTLLWMLGAALAATVIVLAVFAAIAAIAVVAWLVGNGDHDVVSLRGYGTVSSRHRRLQGRRRHRGRSGARGSRRRPRNRRSRSYSRVRE